MLNKVVYTHTRLDDNTVFYVGIGSLKRARSGSGRTKHWKHIVNKAGYKLDLVHENISIEAAKKYEIELIAFYGRLDLKKGLLVNNANGGESGHGQVMSKEAREKMSKNNARFWLGKKRDEAWCKRISAWKKGNITSAESKKKMSDAKIGSKSHLYGLFGKDHPSSKAICCNENNTCYDSVLDASIKLGLPDSSISQQLKGTLKAIGRKKYEGGLTFKYKKNIVDNDEQLLIAV